MSTYVIWMDSEQARVFSVAPTGTTLSVIHHKEIKHHTHADSEKHKNQHQLFGDVSNEIRLAKEIILLGPGLAKDHFMSFLKEHHAHTLATKVVHVATMDHPTDKQILEHSRKFFRTYDNFANPLS